MSYLPKQGDIVWIGFDPAKGREIRKRRLAIITSNSEYNQATKYCTVCPITRSKIRKNTAYYTLNNYETTG